MFNRYKSNFNRFFAFGFFGSVPVEKETPHSTAHALIARIGDDATEAGVSLTLLGGAAAVYETPRDTEAGRTTFASGRADGDGGDWVIFDGRLDDPEAGSGENAAEKVLQAYRRWGHDCPHHLLGDYVFMIWDAAKATLFAARDPAQAHPLYYATAEGRLWFASDPRLLLQYGIVPDDFDRTYLTTYVVLANLNWERTPYSAIRQIPGGHFLEAGPSGLTTGAWWNLPTPGSLRYSRAAEYEEHLRDLLEKSVRVRLRSDSPVSIALSRGIDSAAIAATAQRLLREGNAPCPSVRCLTMALGDYPEGDESGDAARIARHLHLPHTIVSSRPHPGDITPLLGMLPEPSALPDRYNLWEPVRDACAEAGSRVLLTGAGGEMFTSPPYYLADLWREKQIPLFLRELARASRGMSVKAAGQSLLRGLQQPSYDWRPEKRLGNYPWLQRPEDCWTELASTQMAHPVLRDSYYALIEAGQVSAALQPLFTPARIELRNPLLDRRLMEFAYSLPIDLRLRQQSPAGTIWNKPLLRRAFAAQIPPDFAKTNAHLRKYSGNATARGLPAFASQIARPPRGLEEIVQLDILRARLADLRQDRGEKRHLSLTTVLAGWLAATESLTRCVPTEREQADILCGRR